MKLAPNNLLPQLFYRLNRGWLWFTRPLTLGVRLLLVNEQGILLVQHRYQPEVWFLPGGGVEKGETLEQAARREAYEELGAELGDLSLMGVYTNFFDFKSDHVVVFSCGDFKLSPQPNREIELCQFFALTALPSDLAPGHRRRVNEYLRKRNVPGFGMW